MRPAPTRYHPHEISHTPIIMDIPMLSNKTPQQVSIGLKKAAECPVANSLNTIWNANRGQAYATEKRIVTTTCHTARDIGTRKAATAKEFASLFLSAIYT